MTFDTVYFTISHPLLGKRLIDISKELLKHKGKSANDIFGYPDDLKLHSSMTLFSIIPNTNPIFEEVLSTYFNGLPDLNTINLYEE
ncbi:DUF1810 family protein [Pedobacter chinensis]|uniref:DUF1810 family protein n=1 Tax=Pedobacter chinensis TaxID=2282421 RepID=UPI001F336FF5|nr:DUF1810 family protein [Pedobacter chinensis]